MVAPIVVSVSTGMFSTSAALAAVVAIAIAVVAVGCLIKCGLADRLGRVGRFLTDHALGLGAAIAIAATIGSLYYSEVAGFIPCDYCWYQRIAMYPLAVILAVSTFRGDRSVVYTALPFSVVGLGISVYHYQLQLFPDRGSSCSLFAPCTQRWVEIWGFVSIPFMAGAGFLAITGLCLLTLSADLSVRRSRTKSDGVAQTGASGG